MTNRLLLSVAAAALLAGTGFAGAQGTGTNRESGSNIHQSAPAPERGGSAAAPMNRNDASDSKSGMQSTQSDEKIAPGAKPAQDSKKSAQDSNTKSKSLSADERGKADSNMKAGDNNNMNAGPKNAAEKSATDNGRTQTTTGQAGAGAKQLTTEQRTKISTVIKSQHVAPVTNVNFSISVGTRVSRDVGFHPLPAEIITLYPDWRGYEFFLVRDEIVVVDPRTLEIVAVLQV